METEPRKFPRLFVNDYNSIFLKVMKLLYESAPALTTTSALQIQLMLNKLNVK